MWPRCGSGRLPAISADDTEKTTGVQKRSLTAEVPHLPAAAGFTALAEEEQWRPPQRSGK